MQSKLKNHEEKRARKRFQIKMLGMRVSLLNFAVILVKTKKKKKKTSDALEGVKRKKKILASKHAKY